MNARAVLNISWQDVESLPRDGADHVIAYGPEPQQFAELRLPNTSPPHSVIVLFHGGCWLNTYSLDHVSALSRALAQAGYAVWTPEYRRLGDPGGGWPGTFEDVASSVKQLRALAPTHAISLEKVVLMGHSAGGHLALWLAAQEDVSIHGVVSLAGIADLLAYEAAGNNCARSLPALLGGSSREQPAIWALADPVRRASLKVPCHFIHGERDSIVPVSQSEAMLRRCQGQLHIVPGAGHFDLVSPHADAWQVTRKVLQEVFSQ